jgi:branched-subunit amino acid transport protein
MNNTWFFLIGMTLSSFLPRIVPLLASRGRDIPEKVVKWLSYIPAAIFAALIASDIFFWEGNLSFHPIVNVKLLPSLLVLFVSFKFRNLFVSMIAGIIAISLMIYLI